MMVFWNCLSASEKEGFVHGLRFMKKKYNSGSDAEILLRIQLIMLRRFLLLVRGIIFF